MPTILLGVSALRNAVSSLAGLIKTLVKERPSLALGVTMSLMSGCTASLVFVPRNAAPSLLQDSPEIGKGELLISANSVAKSTLQLSDKLDAVGLVVALMNAPTLRCR